MTSIVELFPKVRKLSYDARQQLAQVQNGTASFTDLQLLLEELNQQLDVMETLVLRETPAQRAAWKRKIAELRQESNFLSQQGKHYYTKQLQQMQQTSGYQQHRQELLSVRRRANATNNTHNDLTALSDESQSLASSTNMVGALLQQGEASLNGLVDQRQRMRGIKGVVRNIGQKLGLTQSTMQIIERRDITDAYFVLAGMVVTCIVFYVVWF
jgi:Golgi SNAP receptor complex protein 2